MEASRAGVAADSSQTIAVIRGVRSLEERAIALGARAGYDLLLAAAVAALAVVFLGQLPRAFGVDSWLALAAGREVWQGGIPHHESLTVLSLGASWIDQQWLSQLVTYAEYELGGLGLVGLVNVALIVAGLAGSLIAARRLGARPRTVLLLLPVCAWLVLPAGEVRTQAFALPLFVATVYILAADSRKPSGRVYWCLPLLVLWSNVHGSASLGAGLVALRGLTIAWERRDRLIRHGQSWLRPIALVVGGPLCLLVTPYGTGILNYYHATLFNSALKHAVTEWQPVTSSVLVAIPLFALAAVALWSFGRAADRTTLWERTALIVLAAGAIDAVRNVSFFALAAMIIVGVSLDGATTVWRRRRSPVRPRVNVVLAGLALLLVVVSATATAARPGRAFEQPRLVRVLGAVRAAATADPTMRVFADQKSADWLLWRDPNLAGRVAFDVRFELLSSAVLRRLQRLYLAAGPDWKRAARGYRLLVLNEKDDPISSEEFLREAGRTVLYNDGTLVVIRRSASAAS
jgi:hypothetical protein